MKKKKIGKTVSNRKKLHYEERYKNPVVNWVNNHFQEGLVEHPPTMKNTFGYIVSVHCREEGCIGKYIGRAEGCKIPARGKSQGPRGMYFPMHPDSRQCTSILSALAGKY